VKETMKLKLIISVLVLQILLVANIFPNTNFRVMTYNALFFPSENGAGRLDDFGRVFVKFSLIFC